MSLSDKYNYDWLGFGGMDNCSLCDQLTHVDEFERSDGRVMVLCKRCMFPYFPQTRSKFDLINDQCSGCGRTTLVYADSLMCQACSRN